MSSVPDQELDGRGGAWPSNETNSASGASSPDTVEFHLTDILTIEEIVQEIQEKYPERAALPISNEHDRKLRAECVVEETVVDEWSWCDCCGATDESGGCDHDSYFWQTEREERVVERRAVPWIEAVREILEWYEDYRYLGGRFKKGDDEFTAPLKNSWQPGYQKREFARLKALERQTIGYETCADCTEFFCSRPGEHETEFRPGKYDDPWTAFPTRSASSTPDGKFVPPAEHDRAIVDSWDPVKRVIRYALEERLGLDPDDWEYHRQGEPHAGGGPASGYHHEHDCLFIDAAKLGLSKSETEVVLRAALEPVVERHVESTEWAEMAAHPLDHDNPEKQALSIKKVGPEEGDVSYPSSYLAKYVGIDEFDDLFDRPVEYIMWAASQWATGTQKMTRSDGANQAIKADACTQRFYSPESLQTARHGEEVVRAAPKARHDFECRHCGSPWEVDQEPETLVEHRSRDERPAFVLPAETDAAAAVAGPDIGWQNQPVVSDDGHGPLQAAWSSASAAASGGAPPERIEQRRQIERYVEAHPDAEPEWAIGALRLPPSADDLIGEVLEDRPPPGETVEYFERSEGWTLEAIVDERRRECVDCRETWLLVESPDVCPRCASGDVRPLELAPSGGGIDMRPLIIPEQQFDLEDTLYTCGCGMTMGPASVLGHLRGEHNFVENPEAAVAMIKPVSRGSDA